MRLLTAAAIAMMLPLACSSSESPTPPTAAARPDGGPTSPTTDATAIADVEARCRTLVTTFCDRSVTCSASDAGTPAEQQRSCEGAVDQSLRCEAATSIAASYDDCIAALPKVECAKFATGSADALPVSCRGVVQSPPPPDAGAPPVAVPVSRKPNAILGRRSSADAYGVYLGCLCDAADPDSVLNTAGLYGPQSKFSQDSIWNRFGTFGSDFNTQSACNQFAIDPPVVVNNGQITGKLTRNQFAVGAITDPNVVAFLSQDVCVN